MARPQRNDVDYFPFYCKEGKSMHYIEASYGNDGFCVWVKTLRALATTNFHYLDLSKRQNVMFLTSQCRVTEEVLFKVINDLAELGEIDHDLWTNNTIVWSDKFIESIEDAYKKRSNKIIKKEELLQLLESLGVRKPISEGINSPVNPQSKVKESKVENSKVKDTKETAVAEVIVWPSFSDFWVKYNKHVGKPKAEILWKKIDQGAREKIMVHLDHYIQTDKQYRKDPERYLRLRTWEDEVILKTQSNGITTDKRQQNLNSLAEDFANRVIQGNRQ